MAHAEASFSARIKRAFFTLLGTLFLALAAIGLVVPFLPTTPFLLLSAACYLKGSKLMHAWLLNNRVFGAYIKNYKEGRGMSPRNKVFTISLLWITIIPSVVFLISNVYIQAVMVAVCLGVTIHLLRIPTYRGVAFEIAQAEELNRRRKESA